MKPAAIAQETIAQMEPKNIAAAAKYDIGRYWDEDRVYSSGLEMDSWKQESAENVERKNHEVSFRLRWKVPLRFR